MRSTRLTHPTPFNYPEKQSEDQCLHNMQLFLKSYPVSFLDPNIFSIVLV